MKKTKTTAEVKEVIKPLIGRHITAMEKFEFENNLREVVSSLLEP